MKTTTDGYIEDYLKAYWDIQRAKGVHYKEAFAEAFAQGFAEGFAQGKKEKAIEITLKALKMGLNILLIQELTEFSEAEINQIRKESLGQ